MIKLLLFLTTAATVFPTGKGRPLGEFLAGRVNDLPEDLPIQEPFHWALLIAGSRYWGNYRHQADICHAFQMLKQNGMPEERIIVMVYDDIANHYLNPYPGQLFNEPGGPDVYPGCAKDYVGEDVNVENFLAVLRGDKDQMAGIGSGAVIEPDPQNRVFVFYNDHGTAGEVEMPSGDPLYGIDLVDTLKEMRAQEKFNEMVIYVEACWSGSMFEGILPDDIGVYAVTAANSHENSWATYCGDYGDYGGDYGDDYGDDSGATVTPNALELGTCMANLFSVSFMADTEQGNLVRESLRQQYDKTKLAVSQNGSYHQGSHVMRYGELGIDSQVVGNFLSVLNEPPKVDPEKRGEPKSPEWQEAGEKLLKFFTSKLPYGHKVVDQRDADLVHFISRTVKALESGDPNQKAKAVHALNEVLEEREVTAQKIKSTVHMLLSAFGVMRTNGVLDWAQNLEELVEKIVFERFGRGPGEAVVEDWNCLKGSMKSWQEKCGKFSDHTLKYGQTFANLCNLKVPLEIFDKAVSAICGAVDGEARVDAGLILDKIEGAIPVS